MGIGYGRNNPTMMDKTVAVPEVILYEICWQANFDLQNSPWIFNDINPISLQFGAKN